jgi:hypothetical protein
MLEINNYQGNANQNHSNISPHSNKMNIKKKLMTTRVGKDVQKSEPLYTVSRKAK